MSESQYNYYAVTVHLGSEELYNRLVAQAEKERRSMAAIGGIAIEQYLDHADETERKATRK